MKMRRPFSIGQLNRVLFTAVCLLSCLAFAAPAQSPAQWRQLKPLEGGSVPALLELGGRVYAGTGLRGVFASTDGGTTWREANNGMGNLLVNALVAAGGNILAGTNAGIYRSADGAQSWTLTGADNLAVRSLLASSVGLFAGTTTGRIFRSSDNGVSWVERGAVPASPSVLALVALGENLFAGTARGLFRSADQGQSWMAAGALLPTNTVPQVFALAVSGNTLFAGTNLNTDANNNPLPQVYFSSDNGQSWAAVGNTIRIPLAGLTNGLPNVNALSIDGTTIYAATSFGAVVYNGQEWVEWAGNRGLPIGAMAIAMLRGPTTLLGTSGGVYGLAGDGQSWTAGNAGLTAASIAALAVSGNTIIASAGPSGFFRSGDDGVSWTAISGVDNGNRRNFPVTTLVVKGSSIFAGINLAGGVFRSNDGGVNWTQINTGFRFPGGPLPDLTVSGDDVYAIHFGYIYKLNTEGNGWIELTPSSINASRIAASGSNVYVTSTTGTVLRSTNGGSNFTPVNVGAPISSPFAIAARGSNVYFTALASNGLRIFFSINNGESFTPSQSILRPIAFAFSGDTIFGATAANGVFFSTNGSNWTPVNAGLATRTVNALAIKGETVLAGTNGFGVFAATNPQTQPGTLANTSAASFSPNAELAAESIASAFGPSLAITTQAATAQPLPTTLSGSRITVRDSVAMERDAPLFFVSPGQVNYQVPSGTAPGSATVIAISGDGSSSFGNVTIAQVSPGLFAANANGQGVAAAVVLRRNAAGQDSFEPVAVLDPATNQFVARPIDLGPETDQLFLLLFGTGIRLRSALTTVTARIGGADSQVTFAGALEGFTGLDQCNVRLPRTLAGRGDAEIVLMVDGKAANTVRLTIR